MCGCKCNREMRQISHKQILDIASRAASTVTSQTFDNRTIVIENAIRQALQIVDAKLE